MIIIKTDDYKSNSSYPSISTKEDDNLKDVYKQRRESAIKSMLLKDIEDYIEKNMKEMYKALDELKLSFEDELNNVDGMCYLLIIREYVS